MNKNQFSRGLIVILLVLLIAPLFSNCASGAASAEEYFALGMAYFDLGRYDEAEKWLNRARRADKTMMASEYNLGRIAYETGRYEDSARHFDRILARDGENVMALRSSAYTHIKLGDLVKAEQLYDKVLQLVPESADEGYNYALVLLALEKPEKAEEVLRKYQITMADNSNTLLLFARIQKTLNKPEAIDTYAQWLQQTPSDNQVRYEYAQVLEQSEFYARAIEEYRMVYRGLPSGQVEGAGELTRPNVGFILSRILLTADPEKEDGISELKSAVNDGLTDKDKIRTLLNEPAITEAHKTEIRDIIEEMEKKEAAIIEAEAAAASAAEGEGTGESAVSP
jgi:tetratricopeptide (TPR) repeat protein